MYKVSVVIPTIGESFLSKTIENLLSGSLKPDEIIIVIPKKYSSKIKNYNFNKLVRVYVQEHASQVSQRILGFKKSSNELILQLDADILLKKDCLQELVESLNSNDDMCVAPFYETDLDYEAKFLKKFFFSCFINREKKFFNWDTWFYRHYHHFNDRLLLTKWLPGGCILHKKKNLVLDNYYFYDGAAYDEDLLHSYLLSLKSIKLCIAKKAFAKSINPKGYEHKNFNNLMKYIKRIYHIKKKLATDSKGNLIFYHVWFIQWVFLEYLRFSISKFS